ncbi:hypothetical protein RFI_33018 [Reticulomyxa filosa]|uniref:Viral A-type inclusion protein n=1 Tax=Reticulomyxa filosa TaxID=46433 RepID=X6LTG7_RETFI|nr:hypothetical protein RFI_33018 [Reticulomyxa filosa]|eukprot:ETO04377.1 hypothetical protein RFI_33018 [Reticulomyxa filosa]
MSQFLCLSGNSCVNLHIFSLCKAQLYSFNTQGKKERTSAKKKGNSPSSSLIVSLDFTKKVNQKTEMAGTMQDTSTAGEGQSEEESLKDFLAKHNVRNCDATSQALQKIGVTVKDLMEWREKDIEDVCKEAQIAVMSRADLLKALYKIPESRVCKGANTAPSQVIVIHPNEHDKMGQIYEKFKKASKKVEQVESQIIELEENYKKAKQNISDSCKLIIAAVETHEQHLLNKIEAYKNKKKELLTQLLNQFKDIQQQFKTKNEQINKCINEPNIDMNERRQKLQQLLQDETITDNLSDENEKEVNTNVIVQFTNEKKNIEKLVEMVDQLLKQQMIIVESGSITLTNVK